MEWRGCEKWKRTAEDRSKIQSISMKMSEFVAYQNEKCAPPQEEKNNWTLTRKWKESATICSLLQIQPLERRSPSSQLEAPFGLGYAHSPSCNNVLSSLVPPPARTMHIHPSPNDVLCIIRTHWTYWIITFIYMCVLVYIIRGTCAISHMWGGSKDN